MPDADGQIGGNAIQGIIDIQLSAMLKRLFRPNVSCRIEYSHPFLLTRLAMLNFSGDS